MRKYSNIAYLSVSHRAVDELRQIEALYSGEAIPHSRYACSTQPSSAQQAPTRERRVS